MKHTHHGKGKFLALAAAVLLTAALAGCSSESVTQAQATDIALEHAGVAQEDTTALSVEQDKENGVDVYDIQFTTSDRTYHYDVSQKTGEIVNYSYDGVETAGSTTTKDKTDTTKDQSTSSASKTEGQSTAQQSGTDTQANAAITEEEAKSIALEHAGVTAEEATIYKVKADYDDGRAVYDVEFAVGTTEYDYEISQDTGEVISYDQDVEGWTPVTGQNQTSSQTAISQEQAIQLVLDRIPGAASTDVRIQFERDDGRELYEGEVYYDRTEYDFEIDASTGNFIEWSVDYQD
jgi:uncharacterized membrane protein YkoI